MGGKLAEYRLKYRNFRDNLKVRYSDKVITACINPKSINFIQYPEWHVSGEIKVTRGSTIFKSGNWSEIDVSRSVFWSSKYDNSFMGERRFIPLEKFVFYRALVDRFRNNLNWQDTDWFQWVTAKTGDNPVLRYKTWEEIKDRLIFIDNMYDSMSKYGYRSEERSTLFKPPVEFNYPIVNIGENNTIAIEDGRHRICVAKLAGVDRIPVRIGVVHI